MYTQEGVLSIQFELFFQHRVVLCIYDPFALHKREIELGNYCPHIVYIGIEGRSTTTTFCCNQVGSSKFLVKMRINVRVSSIKGGVERTQPHSLLYSMCISFNQINFEPLAPRNLSIFVLLKFREMEWHSLVE